MHGSQSGRAARLVPFAQGLRPFFLLAGLDALFNIAVWLAVYWKPELWPADAMPAMFWHGHEMVFGFITAAIGGFLLTAVPGWTGRASYAGTPLVALSALWLAGRCAMLPYSDVPAPLAALLDLAFYPALVAVLAPPLVRARKMRNVPFLALLSFLFAADLLFHLGRLGVLNGGEHIGLMLALDTVMVLVVLVGGRIIPAFTQSGLARRGQTVRVRNRAWFEPIVLASIIAVVVVDFVAPQSRIDGFVALAAAAVQFARWLQWHGRRTLHEPLLWVLHLGYLWLIAGLALKGVWLAFENPIGANWLHAFTVGAFGTMILAVMTRASLGHTGRALTAPRPMTASYLLAALAAGVRVFGPAIAPGNYGIVILIAGTLWFCAFALFVIVYAPILLRPRLDGRPG